MFPALVVGTLAAAATYTFLGVNLVSADKAKAMIRSGKIKKVIDVRTMAEYRAGHYRGALHIPVNKINKKTTTELKRRDYSSTAILGNGPDLRQRNLLN